MSDQQPSPNTDDDTNPRGILPVPPASTTSEADEQVANDPGEVVVKQEMAAATKRDQGRKKSKQVRKPLEPSEFRTRMIVGGFGSFVFGAIAAYIGLMLLFPSIPYFGWFSLATIGALVGALVAGAALEGLYNLWTPREDRKDHEATQIAVIVDAAIVLVALVIGVNIPSIRVVCFVIAGLVIAVPILLRIIRGSLSQCEIEATASFRSEYIIASPRVRNTLPTVMKVHSERRRHPVVIIPAIPIVIGWTLLAGLLGRNVPWYAALIAWGIGMLGLTYWFLWWLKDVIVYTDSQAHRIFGVFTSDKQSLSYTDVTSPSSKISFISNWLGGNRYIKVRYVDQTWDTSAQDDKLRLRNQDSSGVAAVAYQSEQKEVLQSKATA